MRTLGLLIFLLLPLGVAGYAITAYALLPLGALVPPDMKLAFLAHQTGIYTHVFASSVALLLGPLQFSPRLRQRYKTVHRWLGRAYLGIGIALGGLSGLYMSLFAAGGILAKLGFFSLATLWLYTGFRAIHAIRQGAVGAHRAWMTRNFSLTLAAVTLRLYLPLALASGIPFETAYPFIAWLCWVPNLLIANRLLGKRHEPDAAYVQHTQNSPAPIASYPRCNTSTAAPPADKPG